MAPVIPARLRFAFAVQVDPPTGRPGKIAQHLHAHELQDQTGQPVFALLQGGPVQF
jgi:hypothetical protein